MYLQYEVQKNVRRYAFFEESSDEFDLSLESSIDVRFQPLRRPRMIGTSLSLPNVGLRLRMKRSVKRSLCSLS